MKKWLLVFTTLFLIPLLIQAQTKEDLYETEWKKADSLFNNGLPKSALKIAEDVYRRAKAKNQNVQMIKAQLYIMKVGYQTSEDAATESITKAEHEIKNTQFPISALWQSIAAELYWSYYQRNRWKILDRTTVSNETKIADFEQWDANRFYEKVTALYRASLSQAAALKSINIEAYDPLLIKGTNTRHLRPTLFDLLAFRAIEFFENGEKEITQPAFRFVMDDSAAFAPAGIFIKHQFSSKDSLSSQFHALKLYQQALALHINDAKPDALIDADMHRLLFAYRNSALPNKKELYRKALEDIENRYASNAMSALASFRLVELMLEEDVRPMRDISGPRMLPANNKDYVAAKKKLDQIISKFPQNEGGIMAKNMLLGITQNSLNIQAEAVVLPDEHLKVLIGYRNISKLWLRIVKVSIDDYKAAYRYGDDNWNSKLLKIAPLQEWSVSTPSSEDYKEHSIESLIDPVSQGMYVIIASANQTFTKGNNNIITYTLFQASRLSIVIKTGGTGYVLHRKKGTAVANATIELYQDRYNQRERRHDVEKTASATSAKDGSFTLPVNDNRGYNAISVRSGDDVLYLQEYLNLYRYDVHQEQRDYTRTFFFTDRSIYRPGQTVYYKGIMLRTQDGGKKNETIAGEKTEVIFYDVNGQKIASQIYTTNEFGSFNGSFIAPQGVLTGSMRISNNTGSANFSIEEYKRPKFAVVFDTLKRDYSLNEMVTVAGRAMAYAGNSVDGATVSYRVVRRARWPYFWAYYGWGFAPTSPEMEITRGTTSTNADGTFNVSFQTIPDRSVDEKTLPLFTYTVYADVTDINGETRAGTQNVNAGYRSINIIIDNPEKGKPSDLDTINIRTENLNGQFVSISVQVRIHKLQSPERVYRKRLWSKPDQYIMDEATFHRYFPLDEYKDEADPMTWPKAISVWDKTVTTTSDGHVAIPLNTWRSNGWYVIEAETKDKNGNQVLEKKYVQVWDKNNSGSIPSALIVVPQQQVVEPGSKAIVYAASGYSEALIIEQVQYMDDKDETIQNSYSGKPIAWERTVDETDRGGISLQYIMVKENRVYVEQANINVPWNNKDLDISWETHRDKLQPGSKETWTMVVRGSKKEKVAAEMVATLYDASLDAFKPHRWEKLSLFPSLNSLIYWNTSLGFEIAQSRYIAFPEQKDYTGYDKSYDRLLLQMDGGSLYYIDGVQVRGGATVKSLESAAAPPVSAQGARVGNFSKKMPTSAADASSEEASQASKEGASEPPQSTIGEIQIRTNLQETAFFYPQLATDADGNVRIQFTIPEALTEWKLLAFAHTKNMSTGILEGKVKTQKDLMIMPGLPRFFRQGDDMVISTKISNLTDKDMNGTASIQILDAISLRPLTLQYRLQNTDVSFSAAKGQSGTATWKIHVPEAQYEPVIIRITAHSGNFSDGEEHMLPVLSNRMLVTETLPLWINGNGTKTFNFDKLKQSGNSKTLSQYNLAVEYTGNPAWYAVQALPYLMEYPHECAEQVFNRYYATALAAHIVDKAPRIKEIFRAWQTIDTAALLSNLEKNQELKSALLEETPWVLDAKNETEQKKRIAMLFEATKLAATLDRSAKQLNDMLLPEGAFPWFKGMYPDRYITQYIATGIVRLQKLGIADSKGNMQRILDRTLPYLDRKVKEDYDELVKSKAKLDQQQPGYIHIQYLYLRSFLNKPVAENTKTAYDYYNKQAAKYWASQNPYMKGMIALAQHRKGNAQVAANIIASLRETAIQKEEMGMYWMDRGQSYWWYEAPIEAQALLIECFTEVAKATDDVNKMRVWLLKQKQTQSWPTTKATADACYALLLQGTQWLTSEPTVTIQLGDKTIRSTEQNQEKGTGYFKVNYGNGEIKPEMGNIKLMVDGSANDPSWGAVYWQYFEDLDKISSAATPLEVKKQLFIQNNTDRGPVLEPITAQRTLKVGDKLISRIEIIVDRDMEYVHLKDMRAAAFEPVNVLSSFKWQGGLGYYESTRDVSTNFFFNYLRKGKYVFEYPVSVTNKGSFSNGIATIQCMYAPEFSSHSEGIKVVVQ